MRRVVVLAAAWCIAVVPLRADQDAQGFFRVVEGAATLFRVEDGQAEAARENAPALAGDRVALAPGARVEVILPDGHRLRLADSADLQLVSLARSLDRESEATALQLSTGALAIEVPHDTVDRTRVDTDAASVLLERGGLYLIEIDAHGATHVVVRQGQAEMLTEFDSTPVRAGDEAVIEREQRGQVALYQAPPLTPVEQWARQLEDEAARAQVPQVEPQLQYASASLAHYGTWVDSGAGYAWRPRVAAGWRPYWTGYWQPSPAGLVWSSYEPWGWVPYHYGSWDLSPTYGWLWYPGAVYSPAHVVWYWGPSYVGWVPSGYYGGYYARHFGFHLSFGAGFFGVSYAGAPAYQDWTFCPRASFGSHYQYRYHADNRVLGHSGGFRGADRAFITADTRGFDRAHWRDQAAVEDVLVTRAHRRTGGGDGLPDVSAVVERSPEVSGATLRNLDSGDERQIAINHARPRGGEAPGDPATTAGAEPGRGGVRAFRSPGLEAPGATGAQAAGTGRSPIDRAGAGERGAHRRGDDAPIENATRVVPGSPVDRTSPARPGDQRGVRVRGADGDPNAVDTTAPSGGASRERPVVDRTVPQRAVGERPAVDRTSPERAVRERPVVDRAAPTERGTDRGIGLDRAVPATRELRQRPVVDRAAPAPRASDARPEVDRLAPGRRADPDQSDLERAPVERTPAVRAERERVPVERAASAPRAYTDRPVVERSSPAPRVSTERPLLERSAPPGSGDRRSTIERIAPAPRAQVERSYAAPPRERAAAPWAPVERSLPAPTIERIAPAPRAQVQQSLAPPRMERPAPASRAQVERSLAAPRIERAAPAPRALAPPPGERAAPAPRSQVERSYAPQSAPAPSSRSETRGGGGGGGGHAARSGGSDDGGDRGGGGHARSGRPQH